MSSVVAGGSGRATLSEKSSESARWWPNQLAMVTLDDTIAAQRADRGVCPGRRVALRLSPGIDVVAAQLAILKTGAAYVPYSVCPLPKE